MRMRSRLAAPLAEDRMNKRIALFIVAVFAASLSACRDAPTSISIDFPQGETRLLVEQGGEALLYYGALPASRTVKKGIFDVSHLYLQLLPRLHQVAPRERWPDPKAQVGMVSMRFEDGSTAEYLIFDAAFARSLLDQARRNVIPAAGGRLDRILGCHSDDQERWSTAPWARAS